MSEGRTRRLAAVSFADIVGYTALSTRDENAALEVVDEFQRLSKEAVGEHGRVVKFLGDGALSVFESTSRALESAIWLRDAFEASEVAQSHGCTLSVGVHVGEVVQAEDGDVYGDGVNVAARIEGVATSNQVVISDGVYRLIRNRPEYNPQSIGEHMLKGVEKPQPLYVLARPGEKGAAPKPAAAAAAVGAGGGTDATPKSYRHSVAVGTLAGVTGFVLLSVFVAWSVDIKEDPAPGDQAPPEVVDASQSATGGATEPDAPTPDPNGADRALADDDRTAAGNPPTDGAADPGRDGPEPDPVAGGGGSQTAAADPAPAADQDSPASSGTTDPPVQAPADANRLLVLVFGEQPAQVAEAQILRSLGNVGDVTAVDAPAATLVRRNADAARAAMQGDFAALGELARRNGIEYLVLGDLVSAATPLRAGMFSGSAQLDLRMYRVSTGEIIDMGSFTSGMGNEPPTPGRTELGVRREAAQAVGRQGAVAANRWLRGALRN